MRNLLNTLLALTLTAALATNAFARHTDEAFDAALPKPNGPHAHAGHSDLPTPAHLLQP